jgi:hypothetical protein
MDYKTTQINIQTFEQESKARQQQAAQENALRTGRSNARLLRRAMAADTFTLNLKHA